MKISYHWIKEYIDLTDSPEDVAKMLTATGLEVECITPFETVKGGLKDLVIGETLTCIKHPNADRLSLTTVDIGEDAPYQIVCGAPNIAAHQKVVVAKPGTTIHPLHKEPFTIKKTKIRGESSQGMICAQTEIGLEETRDGIIVLDDQTIANGTPAAAFYKIETDYIFEIGLTPNRGDAASHIGVIRDLKALTGLEIRLPSVNHFTVENTTKNIAVTIENEEACPRYAALTLSEVTIKDSPKWLQNRLRSIGLSPINNVVDVTNYVCHELGQPLHAFDADHIAEDSVVIKTLPAGTPFKTLDGKKRTLTANDLMVCNPREGMCMAGIFGGLSHGVTQKTKTIFLESAHFSSSYIRRTAVHHQLKTDASFRFERGTDPTCVVYALKRAAMLIKEIARGVVSSKIIDLYPHKIAEKEISVKDEHVHRLIGKKIERKKIFNILELLDMPIKEKNDSNYTVLVPPYRVGIEQETDIIEEILRIYGFDNIDLKPYAGTTYLSHFPKKDINRYQRSLGEMLTTNGYYEIITNSITKNEYHKKYPITVRNQQVKILNSSNEDQNTLRQTLLFTGLEVCAYNINRQQKNLKLFEWGKVYQLDGAHYKEDEKLAMYITGNTETENWQHKSRSVTYFDLVQHITAVLEKCHLAHSIKSMDLEDDPLFEYGVKWLEGSSIVGKSGKIKTSITKNFGITQTVFYAEFGAKSLFDAIKNRMKIKTIPKYPEVRRDLSLILDKSITFKEIMDLVLQTEKKYIKDLIVFDVYEGSGIPVGKKAYGIGFILLDTTKTLKDKEIDNTMNRLIAAFEQKMQATIRK